MNQIKRTQTGMGLVEVLVALLLLAVAVMGFSAMQMRAIKATDESLMRTRALTVIRGAAEMMRANVDGIMAFKTALNGTATSVTNEHTKKIDGTAQAITKDSCISGGTPEACTIKQLATKDALTVKQYATDNALKIAMVTCPLTGATTSETTTGEITTVTTSVGQERQCLIASWDNTDPILLDTAVATDVDKDQPCADEDGIYHMGVSCFIVEAY